MEVKWIKIVTDIFDDEKILLIEALPEADSIITIWFKLLCLAGKQNNGGVFMMTDRIPYTTKMLATIFRRKESTVELALRTFEEFDMIEIIDGVITIPNWGKHQSIEQLERRKEYQKQYKRQYRQRQRETIEGTAQPALPELEPEPETEPKTTSPFQHDPDYLHIIDYLNSKCGTSFRPQTKKTQQLVKARMAEGYTVDDFEMVIDRKSGEWKNDPKMCNYLRPETLFGTKFESYLVSHNGVAPVQIQEPQSKYQ